MHVEVRRHDRRRSPRHHASTKRRYIVDERPPRAQHDLQLRRRPHQPRRQAMEETGRSPTSRPSTTDQDAGTRRRTAGTPSSSPTTTTRASSPAFGDDSAANSASPSAKLLATMLLTLHRHALRLPGRRARHDQLSLPVASKTSTTSRPSNGYKTRRPHRPRHRARITSPISARHEPRQRPHTHAVGRLTPTPASPPAAKPWLAVNPNYTEINAKAGVSRP